MITFLEEQALLLLETDYISMEVKELPIAKYRRFSQLVTASLDVLKQHDNGSIVMHVWDDSKQFRYLVTEALKLLGIDAALLTPRELELLLYRTPEKPIGYIFQLHDTYPKLNGGLEPTPQQILNSIYLTLHTTMGYQSATEKAILVVLRSLLLCVISILNITENYFQTQNSRSKSNTKNGWKRQANTSLQTTTSTL